MKDETGLDLFIRVNLYFYEVKTKSVPATLFRFVWKAGLFFVCFSFVLVMTYRWLPVQWTPLMFIRLGQSEERVIAHRWVSGAEIPNSMQLAVVCTEDQNYLRHSGFDFEAIERAMQEAEEGGRSRGASTISQQTAKNVFLWPSSNYVRKGFEVWFTLLIELCWSKERIMTVYLNSIEFGRNTYGVEAASQRFFKHSASRLTKPEAALLAVALPNPLRYKVTAPGDYLRRRQAWALQQMQFWGGKLIYEAPPPPVKPAPRKRKRKSAA